VVKEKQFVIIISSKFDLRTTQLTCKLVYDYDDVQLREVPCTRNSPIEYKAFLDSQGTRATVELKIKVLTSQHEDMLFRVLIQSVGTPELHTIVSHPIRVVSKPALLKHKNTRNGRKTVCTKRALESSEDSEDKLQNKIQHIENQQREHQQILQELSQRSTQDALSFDCLFSKFLAAFSTIPQEQRDQRIKQAISSQGLPSPLLKELFDALGGSVQQTTSDPDFGYLYFSHIAPESFVV